MAIIRKGRNVELHVYDAGGTSRDLTAYWIGGDPEFSDESVDVTTYADTARRNNPGLQNASMTFTFLMDSTGTTSPWVVITGLLASNSTAQNIEHYPEGTAGSKAKITLPVRCIRIAPGGAIGAPGVFDAEFVIDGTRTVGTV